jgi:hypothetical protein
VLCDWVLYLRQFPAEVLNKYFLEPAGEFHRLLADHLEALIDRTEVLYQDPGPRFQCFFEVSILGFLADFLIDLGVPKSRSLSRPNKVKRLLPDALMIVPSGVRNSDKSGYRNRFRPTCDQG